MTLSCKRAIVQLSNFSVGTFYSSNTELNSMAVKRATAFQPRQLVCYVSMYNLIAVCVPCAPSNESDKVNKMLTDHSKPTENMVPLQRP